MEEILAALAAAGEVRHLQATVPVGESPQYASTETFAREVGFCDGDWYLWLDADEFLNVHVGDRTVGALIDAMGDKCCALINWRLFGTSGHESFPGRFIDPAFTGAAKPEFPTNCALKTLFRNSPAFAGFARHGIHRPLVAPGSDLVATDVLVGSGNTSSADSMVHSRWLSGMDVKRTSRVGKAEFGWKLAQINHYSVRTANFFALKALRGRGYTSRKKQQPNSRHTDEFFREHDRNEVEDRSILHWKDRVTAEIDRLMQIPDVAAAVAASQVLVAGHLAQLAAPISDPMDAAGEGNDAFAMTFAVAERGLLESWYAKASSVLEYGGGGSTLLATGLGLTVVSVESDMDRAHRLAAHLSGMTDKARVHLVDIGPTGADGGPLKPRAHLRFHRYPLSVWDRPDLAEPDLVLIAGPFRAACLAAVKLRATRPTTVLFADYADRAHYHGVERLAAKEEVAGHMARFTVTPGPIPPEMMTEVVGWFSDPR